MNKNILIVLGGAVAVAALVGIIVQVAFAPKKVASNKSSTEVLVANKLLVIGQKLKGEDVRWQSWPDDAAYKGLIKKADQPDPANLAVYGAPLRRDIESGEPVTMQALIADTKGAFLSAIISPGMRAMAVAVKSNTGAGGFVAPGDHVDVILAYTAKLVGQAQDYAPAIVQRVASQLVLSNVKVLAVDQNSKDDTHEAKEAKTVTLEVTLEGAQKLALATQMGDLSLSLRRLGEKDDPNGPAPPLVTDVTATDVIKKINAQMTAEKANQKGTVRMYSGNVVQNVPVRK
jgi:pilus assembly protein CpaB